MHANPETPRTFSPSDRSWASPPWPWGGANLIDYPLGSGDGIAAPSGDPDRTAPESAGEQGGVAMSVAEAAKTEHDRLRDLLTRLERTVRWGIAPDVTPVLSRLRRDLEAHRDREERVVYPALARLLGREEGPVACMLEEHEDLGRRLRDLAALAAQGIANPAVRERMRRESRAWTEDLRAHFDKEEKLVFPLADHLLPEGERVALAAAFGPSGPFPSLRELLGEDTTEGTWSGGQTASEERDVQRTARR